MRLPLIALGCSCLSSMLITGIIVFCSQRDAHRFSGMTYEAYMEEPELVRSCGVGPVGPSGTNFTWVSPFFDDLHHQRDIPRARSIATETVLT